MALLMRALCFLLTALLYFASTLAFSCSPFPTVKKFDACKKFPVFDLKNKRQNLFGVTLHPERKHGQPFQLTGRIRRFYTVVAIAGTCPWLSS